MGFKPLLVVMPPDTRDFDAALNALILPHMEAADIFFWRGGTKGIGSPQADAEFGLDGTERAGDVCRVAELAADYRVHDLITPAGWVGWNLFAEGEMPIDPATGTWPPAEWARRNRAEDEWFSGVLLPSLAACPPDWLAVEVYANT